MTEATTKQSILFLTTQWTILACILLAFIGVMAGIANNVSQFLVSTSAPEAFGVLSDELARCGDNIVPVYNDVIEVTFIMEGGYQKLDKDDIRAILVASE